MKKVLVMALMLGAGLAYASSLGVPWFVDNAPTGVHPPRTAQVEGYVFIHNNHSEVLDVKVAYYTANGFYIGPEYDNTFLINPYASLAFRPVQDDALYESANSRLIPNRPRTTDAPSTTDNDFKKNGALTFEWLGDPSYLTGAYWMCQVGTTVVSATDPTEVYAYIGYGHLLPAGA